MYVLTNIYDRKMIKLCRGLADQNSLFWSTCSPKLLKEMKWSYMTYRQNPNDFCKRILFLFFAFESIYLRMYYFSEVRTGTCIIRLDCFMERNGFIRDLLLREDSGAFGSDRIPSLPITLLLIAFPRGCLPDILHLKVYSLVPLVSGLT